ALATEAETPHVQVEVITVGRVVLRPQGHPEAVARRIAHLAQEPRLRPLPVPVPRHADAPAVLEAEAGDIQGVGAGMLAAPLATADVAAGEAAEMIDPRHRLAEGPPRRRLQAVLLE